MQAFSFGCMFFCSWLPVVCGGGLPGQAGSRTKPGRVRARQSPPVQQNETHGMGTEAATFLKHAGVCEAPLQKFGGNSHKPPPQNWLTEWVLAA